MKKLSTLAIALCALTIPALSFAQGTAPITRAQVVAELAQLEQAGYDPAAGESVDYPAKLQAAEAKVAQQQAAQAQRAQAANGQNSAASDPNCVGPASFCNVYFGS
ncbi:DUF4148 domain-containing protein [Burkholderia gladioli]|uniref:DUF4148 domain-containing protein n=1 Tax=Burkholderia gladioli TaxID=28095 RepID=UPI00163E75C1|nr:DUF4148 domain-containing protein [Burkholderia gladioli]MDN7720390.1 DUF4148 domain-containing protein [Burkholderia gladioli]